MVSITLKCGTVYSLTDLEDAKLSYVPCGEVDGKDQPILKFSHLWSERRHITRETYGKNWNAFTTADMSGIQIMTGFPTYRRAGKGYIYYTSLDVEAHFVEQYSDHVQRIRSIYEENVIGDPCILKTKSGGLRLDAYTPYVGSKMSFQDDSGKMLFEMLGQKCLARLDGRYEMITGSLLDMPTLPKSALHEIYYVVSEVATKEQSDEKPREVVGKSQIGELDIEWDSKGRSQLFPSERCRVSSHKSNRLEVRFSKSRGGIDGKCFNCGGTWWEIEPRKKPEPPPVSEPIAEPTDDSEKPSAPQNDPPPDTLPPETTSNIDPLPVDNTNGLPEFPDFEGELFSGAFQNLYQAYVNTHVWSPEMVMAIGLGGLAYVAGRSITVQTDKLTKPQPLNTYILAVGESDLTAKSEALTEIEKHIRHCQDDFSPLSNVQSMEGVLKALDEDDNSTQYGMYDETSVVFANSRREGTKNLLGGLNELWLCRPSYRTARAKEIGTVEMPYLNCWGNIPTQLIPAVFRQEDLIAGTLNRWLPFYITPKIKTERSPHAEPDYYDAWIQRLKSIYEQTDRQLIFTDEADEARYKWYDDLRQKAIRTGQQTGESRFHTHAIKIAGLFALADNQVDDHDVRLEHWENALGVSKYLSKCYEYLFRNVGATRLGELENRILEVLNQHGNEMTLTELNRKTRGFDSIERQKIIDTLTSFGMVVTWKEKTTGRGITKIRRIQ